MRGLVGRVALVTGAAGGIGRATARRLAEEGAKVGCSDIKHEAIAELVDQLSEDGLSAFPVELDVRERDGVREVFDAIVAEQGGVHALAVTHGVYHQADEGKGPVEGISPEKWELVMRVNLMGVVHVCEAALPHMKRQRYGRIAVVSSAAAVLGGTASGAAYAVSKAGVTVFVKCVAREGAPYGITANSVAPGQIDTPMTAVVLERVPLEAIVERTPLGRLGMPEEIASAIAYLCSDDASFVTGQMLGVNGGMLMV